MEANWDKTISETFFYEHQGWKVSQSGDTFNLREMSHLRDMSQVPIGAEPRPTLKKPIFTGEIFKR